MLDRLTEGNNKVVLGWKRDVELLWERSEHSASLRRKLAKSAPGFAIGFDNVGLVSEGFMGDFKPIFSEVP